MTAPLSVLMIEDSEDDAALLVRHLRQGGYEPTYERVDTSAGMSAALDKKAWDFVIGDYSMPHFSGTDALKLLRARSDTAETPFIFVSGTIGEEAAVAALKQGAQDYIMKNNLERLLPAINRELHEAQQRREVKRLEQQIHQLQKFEAIGRLAGGIAHDFNNALCAVLGWAQLGCQDVPEHSPAFDKFKKIADQARRSAGLTAQLLAFARRQVLLPSNLNLNDSICETITLLQSVKGERTELKIIAPPDLRVIRADPAQIEQVLMNLFLNARDAMPNGGNLVIETRNVEISQEDGFCLPNSKPGPHVLLSVSDTGIGMDAATRERIFEPFFTTKKIGKGTGMGLATVYGIVKQHNGFIVVESELGKGTTFRVYFPTSDGVADPHVSPVKEAIGAGTETILLADDNEALREIARRSLSKQGYQVILAADGQEAVRLFQASAKEIELVILDVGMPILSGSQAYTQMCAVKPNLPAIFTTGYTSESSVLFPKVNAGTHFLRKPYALEALSSTVRSALTRKRSAPGGAMR
jgi:two-component system cell cycle sensor histidine kinase/response regulator CckA